MERLWIGCAALALVGAGALGGEQIRPGDLEIGHWFDFYEGVWDYTFDAGGGSVEVELAHDGRVMKSLIPEGRVGDQTFSGSSMAGYDAEAGGWKQVWADSFGNFIDITVTADGDKLVGTWEQAGPQGAAEFRHTFYDIHGDRFRTELAASQDGGETWITLRDAEYARRAE